MALQVVVDCTLSFLIVLRNCQVTQDCSQKSNVPLSYVANSSYTIESCRFHNNTARIQNETESTFILPHLETHMAFSRGAGVSIFLKGHAMNNSIYVKDSTFMYNQALWGAGLFIEFQDFSYNNNFSMESSVIESNYCFHYTSEDKGTGGGGARLGHIFFNQTHVSHNHMSFSNVEFAQNKAYYGGGLSLYTTKEPMEPHATNTLAFFSCKWVSNVARVGSGVDLSKWHPVPYGAIAEVNFTDCTFSNNTAQYTSLLGEYVGIGAVYSDFIPVNFHGEIRFESNSQTALACVGARLSFQSDCVAEFHANSGRNGGAIALMGYSFIEVSRNTTLKFMRNNAEFVGGAIFGQSIGEHDLISSRNCFIRYDKIEVKPLEWESTFYFEDNRANTVVNSIYATSLLTCLWGGAYGSASTHGEANDVFCWNRNLTHPTQWVYNNSSGCKYEIATSPAKFLSTINATNDCIKDNACNVSVNVIPGLSTVLPFYTVDDRGSNVTDATVLTAKVVGVTEETKGMVSIDNTSLYISDNSIELHGMPNESAYIKLETIAPRVLAVQIKVNLSTCPPGMISPDGKSRHKCSCGGTYANLVNCHPSMYYSDLRRGAWIGMLYNYSFYVAGECPYCSFTNNRTLRLPQDGTELPSTLCHSINRTGTLCGSCLPGYGPVVNGYGIECHHCPASKDSYNWVFYLMTEFLPVTIFFFVVVLFNISVSSGPANAFVFFAQVLTTVFKVNGDGAILSSTKNLDVLTALYVIPYDIWNQNFFHPFLPKFCLSSKVSTLQILSTGFVTALYPLLLVIIFSAFVWAYGRGFKPVVCLCRPVHRCFARLRGIWNLQRSIVHALATFMILSYTKFTLVSFILITATPLLDDVGSPISTVLYYDGTIPFMGPDHIPYVIVSFFVLATFVALPPIVLSVPSLIHLTKKLYKKVHHKDLDLPAFFNPGPTLDQFLNAFHGCYKDGTGGSADNNIDCRWFAGLYFVLRLVIFLVFAFTSNWFLQYVIQQLVCIVALLFFVLLRPYKNQLFNIVDACIFANLTAIATLSMYNFHFTTIGNDLSLWPFIIQYILIFLPLLYMVIYVLHILWKKYGKFCRKKKSLLTAADAEDENFLEYADQEERYRNISGSYQHRVLVNANHNLQIGHSPPSVVHEEEEEGSSQGKSRSLTSPPRSSGSSEYGATGRSSKLSSGLEISLKLTQDTHTGKEGKAESLVDITA